MRSLRIAPFFGGVLLIPSAIPSAPFLSTFENCRISTELWYSLRIRLYVLKKGLTRTNPIVGMGCLDHQTYENSGRVWILRENLIVFQLPSNSAMVTFLLVGGWTTHLKNMSQTGLFPQVGINIIKCLKPPASLGWLNDDPLKKGESWPSTIGRASSDVTL